MRLASMGRTATAVYPGCLAKQCQQKAAGSRTNASRRGAYRAAAASLLLIQRATKANAVWSASGHRNKEEPDARTCETHYLLPGGFAMPRPQMFPFLT